MKRILLKDLINEVQLNEVIPILSPEQQARLDAKNQKEEERKEKLTSLMKDNNSPWDRTDTVPGPATSSVWEDSIVIDHAKCTENDINRMLDRIEAKVKGLKKYFPDERVGISPRYGKFVVSPFTTISYTDYGGGSYKNISFSKLSDKDRYFIDRAEGVVAMQGSGKYRFNSFSIGTTIYPVLSDELRKEWQGWKDKAHEEWEKSLSDEDRGKLAYYASKGPGDYTGD